MLIVANCYRIAQLFILFYLFLFIYLLVFSFLVATISGELKIVIIVTRRKPLSSFLRTNFETQLHNCKVNL